MEVLRLGKTLTQAGSFTPSTFHQSSGLMDSTESQSGQVLLQELRMS